MSKKNPHDPSVLLLGKASLLIQGERKDDYGSFEDNARKLAELWSTVLETRVPPEKVALMLVMLKAMRLINNPHHEDSWVDLIGYAGLSARVTAEGDKPLEPSD